MYLETLFMQFYIVSALTSQPRTVFQLKFKVHFLDKTLLVRYTHTLGELSSGDHNVVKRIFFVTNDSSK